MSLSSILREVRGTVTEFHTITNDDIKKHTKDYKDLDEFINYIDSKGLDWHNFKIVDGRTLYYAYYVEEENGVYVECPSLEKNFLEMVMCANNTWLDSIEHRRRDAKKLFDTKRYEALFCRIATGFRIHHFLRVYKDIDPEYVYSTWEYVYSSVDYDGVIAPEVLDYIEKFAPNKRPLEEVITVYRGVGSKSTPLDKTLSWTTDINVAIKFMSNALDGAGVWVGEVKSDDIVSMIDLRDEKEVIIRSEDVIEPKLIPMVCRDSIDIAGLADTLSPLYMNYCNMIKSNLYRCRSIHGELHSKHMVFLTLAYSHFDGDIGLSNEELDCLSYFCILHDIGRVDDSKDDNHGIESLRRIRKENILLQGMSLNSMYTELAEIMIEYHCVDDIHGERAIKREFMGCGEFMNRALYLFKVCKDIDALDRFRISDLDYNMLRTETAKKLVPLASRLNLIKL